MIWLFDIDGTLTPARQLVDPNFKKFFLQWVKGKEVYLATGSDYPKALEQLGEEIIESVSGVYASMGNSYWIKNINQYNNNWDIPQDLLSHLESLAQNSKYQHKTSNHIEIRQGMINFSTIGRDCTLTERRTYFEWDRDSGERLELQQNLLARFPEIDVQIGGQISMDIIPRGKDKAQISEVISGPAVFFGDHLHEGGNDFTLGLALLNKHNGSIAVHTTGWEDTYTKLTQLFN
jgi:phosphomannomutase